MAIVKTWNGKEVEFESVVPYMDRELCEVLHSWGIDDEQMFFDSYAELHLDKYHGEEFAPYYDLAW